MWNVALIMMSSVDEVAENVRWYQTWLEVEVPTIWPVTRPCNHLNLLLIDCMSHFQLLEVWLDSVG
jgi:hypothetical protein